MAESEHTADSFVFKTDRPWPNARLKVAAIVGHATDSGVRIWLRTGRPGEFSLLLYRWDSATEGAGGETALRFALGEVPLTLDEAAAVLPGMLREDFRIDDYAADTTHVVDLEGLDPDTRYGYAIHAGGEDRVLLGHNRLRRFRTPPQESERRAFQFALFSCHMPYAVHGLFGKRTETTNLDMWDFLGATLERHGENVDLVIAGGDQCYSDGVATLDIWHHLNRTMRKEGEALLPDEEAMRSWYRDVYRGYWGFEGVQRVFDGYPTYMVWDDHEIGDGWGSHRFDDGNAQDGLRRRLPGLDERGLSYDDGLELMQRMFRAARQTYVEYQHSHNPPTDDGALDYAFTRGGCAFYVLDGRGQRDIARESYRILGREQFDRFAAWAGALTPEETPFAFVVSAVPVLHTRSALVQADDPLDRLGLGDDLRDSWEHEVHDTERKALMAALFGAAARGVRVSVLSGDVHVSAVFAIEDGEGNRIFQLTSSAITYNLSLPQSWILRAGAADDGVTPEGHRFERLALYTDSGYALVAVDPGRGEAWFKLYGEQKLDAPPDSREGAVALSHSLAKIRLF
ncbi:MAG: alkaline phosphatase D family protein [Rhodospirillaceae bacterium]|nr:alkaline phosphatase D family protein [Rhodospirillaceae bacterium]MDD9997206.1 alkaline phosphatase D family protein [Rhodospirillaceae bacterium]MDE0361340.1 alkaline phosphatase D family protein [Rhodospirillaceae bacterium]